MRRQRIIPKKECGIALISAILIAALVASLAFALSARERLWLNQVENRRDLSAAQAVAFASIDLARFALRDDMRNSQLDHLLETWTVPIPPIAVEEGKASGRLIEMQGRFNLFALQRAGKPDLAGVDILQNLLTARNLPSDWALKMARAMATQATLLPAPNERKLLPVANLSELAQLAEIDPARLVALDPLLTILPENTAVNVNFAAPEILAATTPGLTLGEAEQVVSRRAAAHFRSVQDYVNALPERLRGIASTTRYCVESQYFIAKVDAWFGRAHLRYNALIYRQRNRMPELLWVQRI